MFYSIYSISTWTYSELSTWRSTLEDPHQKSTLHTLESCRSSRLTQRKAIPGGFLMSVIGDSQRRLIEETHRGDSHTNNRKDEEKDKETDEEKRKLYFRIFFVQFACLLMGQSRRSPGLDWCTSKSLDFCYFQISRLLMLSSLPTWKCNGSF